MFNARTGQYVETSSLPYQQTFFLTPPWDTFFCFCGESGTGKTHTIANIICASLCHGKRVLITSKGAAALSVIRERLPPSVQDLCVDVSLSESQGMRQLQQTVERLANRVACVSTDTEAQKCHLLSVSRAGV